MGIGNELRGDDGLGPYIINRLKDKFNNNIINTNTNNIDNSNHYSNEIEGKYEEEYEDKNEDIIFIDAGSAPENFTGEIKKKNPSHILIIDAAFMNTKPGTIKSVKKDEIANINVSTHSMSLSYLIKYLELDNEFNILFIGIEPLSIELKQGLSVEVLKSSDILKNIIFSIINDIYCN
jgi:hydrogenase 3 maturation protease